MKKFLAILMILTLLAGLPFVLATSETAVETTSDEVEQIPVLEGTVTELVDGGFLLMDKQQGEVMINVSDATVLDGLLTEIELEVGQYVFVDFNGAMTRSLPPQAHADRVSLYMLSGMVVEKLEDGSILMTDDVNGEVIVHLPEGMAHVNVGAPITVYHNGVMAMSLPAQITASDVRLPLVEGEITEVTEDGFLLTAADGTVEFAVNLGEETIYTVEYALTTLPADEADATSQTAEEVTVDAPAFAAGDKVTVYYNGAMTRSIPAQIFALEVVVSR